MIRIYGFVGLTLVIISYILGRFSIYDNPHLIFEIGYWLFFDSMDYHLSGNSMLHMIKKNKKLLFYLILMGAMIGAFFDLFGVILSNVWKYPEVIDILSGISLYVAWGVFLLMIYSSYMVFLAIVKKEFGIFGKKLVKKSTEKKIYSFMGIASILLLTIPTFSKFIFGFPSYTYLFGLNLIGFWMILEYIEYKRHEKSLLKDILEGYWNPLLAIVIGSLITSIVWENMNLGVNAWVYQNLPLGHISILGIPLAIILGWPALYIIYLSFYRAIFKGRDIVW